MRVLEIINNLQPAGAERLLRDLMPRFRERGWTPELFLLHSTDSWLEKDIRESFVVHDGGSGSPCAMSRFWRLAAHVLRNRDRYDLIHVHLFPAQLFAAWTSFLAPSVPIVATEHSTTNRRRRIGFRTVDRWMYRRFATVVGVSEAVSNELGNWLEVEPGPVVWNGIELAKFALGRTDALKRELGIRRPLILSIGRFHPPKDQATAIRALPHLPSAGLALVGVGPEMQFCRDLAAKLGVSERVWFLGERSDVPQLIAGSDLYLQCSRWEGFGIAVVEAMAGGLPVMGTSVDGFRQVVADAGLFFAPGDHLGLARVATEILDHPDLRSELSQRSRVRASEFNIERTADEYCRVFDQTVRAATRVSAECTHQFSTGENL